MKYNWQIQWDGKRWVITDGYHVVVPTVVRDNFVTYDHPDWLPQKIKADFERKVKRGFIS